MTHYLIETIIVKLEEKSRASHAVVVGKDPATGRSIFEIQRENIGWFVLLQNSHEWLFLGFEKPELYVGQAVIIRLEPKDETTPVSS